MSSSIPTVVREQYTQKIMGCVGLRAATHSNAVIVRIAKKPTSIIGIRLDILFAGLY
jgi:hypothetical protein